MKESKTTYSYLIEHMQEPSFEEVWDIAFDFVQKLPEYLCNELHESLNRGVDILDSEPLLQMYIYSFGKMHNAKLQYAFENIHNKLDYKEIEIVDYGCGQGLATICYHDFMIEHNAKQIVRRITLIEPSVMALSRAELLCSKFYPEAEIVAINKRFDELANNDLVLFPEIPTIHLFSNILDVESYNIVKFAELVKNSSKGDNEYVIVSPLQNSQRMQRLKTFASTINKNIYFEQYLDKRQLDKEKDWTCAVILCSKSLIFNCERVFEEAISFIGKKDKDLTSDYCMRLFNEIKACAELGDKRCENLLGICYEKGIGTEQNFNLALLWYKKTAEQEYAPAFGNLGDLYRKGEGVEQDISKAIEFYTLGAEKNHPKSCYTLAKYYETGEYVGKDERKALDLYIKSAELGYCPSQEKLGLIYMKGLLGEGEHPSESFNWFYKAAEQGSAYAQNNVGFNYWEGYGINVDYNLAFEWFSRAAKQNYPAAINNLAICYENGEGTDVDLNKAVFLYEKSAKMGYVLAQKNLALCYMEGVGVEPDPNKVFLWTLKAAKQSDLESLVEIAFYYFKGFGICKSNEKALMWYAKYYSKTNSSYKIINSVEDAFDFFFAKADEGDAQALYIIGKCLQYGVVAKKNSETARKYFEKAAELRHIESLIKVGQVSSLNEFCSIKEDKKKFKDDYGVKYSIDKKILIDSGYQNTDEYKIPVGTRIICNGAFKYGTFKKIVIPSSVLIIGKNPFVERDWRQNKINIECHSDNYLVSKDALYTHDMKKLISFFGKSSKFTIPQGVEVIGENAFEGNENLTDIKFPNSLRSIEDEAFLYCLKLKRLSLPKNVSNIGIKCFYGCESLSEVLLYGEIRVIKTECFMGCNITKLVLPDSLVEIEDNAFNSNYKLKDVNLPSSVIKIGNSCFAYCDISDITLNDNLQEIGDFCFYQCPIDKIVIPSKVKKIGINPFIGIKIIECKENDCFVSENGLLYNKMNGDLIAHFEDTEIGLYPPICRVKSFAFYNSNVTDIFMGKNIVEIEPWAFYKAKKLESVFWKKCEIKEIPKGCFGECKKICKIDIPSTVEEVQEGSFFDCCNLRKMRFERNDTKVKETIFKRIGRFSILTKSYHKRHPFMGSTIMDTHYRSNLNINSFTKIEIIVPYGCSDKYVFSAIYDKYCNEELRYYGMDRNFIVKEYENE